jgi:hypothetical protein
MAQILRRTSKILEAAVFMHCIKSIRVRGSAADWVSLATASALSASVMS